MVKDDTKFNQTLPWYDLLKDSLYYPYCYKDIKPINSKEEYAFFYIYADLTIPLKEYSKWEKLNLSKTSQYNEDNQLTYTLVEHHRVKFKELIYRNWRPPINPSYTDQNFDNLLLFQQTVPTRYVYWSIWKRNNQNNAMP